MLHFVDQLFSATLRKGTKAIWSKHVLTELNNKKIQDLNNWAARISKNFFEANKR